MKNSYNRQLVEFRKQKNLSIYEASKQMGVFVFFLFLYENGYFRPSKKNKEKIENFYKEKIDYSNGKEYPEAYPHSETPPRFKKKTVLTTAIIALVSVAMFITGFSLLNDSAKNNTAHYGEVYTQAREKAVEGQKSGRDLITNLEYYYLDNVDTFADDTITFYKTNSILYFNDAIYTCNLTSMSYPELGTSRYHYQFGGSLDKASNICTFNFGSSKGGMFFSAEVDFKNAKIDSLLSLNVITQSTIPVSEELAINLFNICINDVTRSFSSILSNTLGREISFYDDFLPAREQGRQVNFAMQVVGLAFIVPSLIGFFVSVAILLVNAIKGLKPLALTSKDNDKKKPLPKDLNINIGIPDYLMIWISNILGYGSLILLLFCSIGKLVLPLPDFLTNDNFLTALRIGFVTAPFLKQYILFGSIRRVNRIFIEIVKYLLLYTFIASLETTIIAISNAWGYDIASLIYKFIPSNIFLAVVLNYFIFFFLFYTPKFINEAKRLTLIIWRSLSLIPLGMIIVTIIVGNSYELFYGTELNIFMMFWISNTEIDLSMMFVLFLYSSFIVKTLLERKYGKESAHTYFNGNTFNLINNLMFVSIVITVGLIDLAFRGNEVAYYIGLGNNVWIFALVPIVLFTKFGPNSLELTHLE